MGYERRVRRGGAWRSDGPVIQRAKRGKPFEPDPREFDGRPFATGGAWCASVRDMTPRTFASLLVYPSRDLLAVRRAAGIRALKLARLNNDYTRASADGIGEQRRLTHGADSITFVTETNRDGTCMIAPRSALDALARAWLAELER